MDCQAIPGRRTRRRRPILWRIPAIRPQSLPERQSQPIIDITTKIPGSLIIPSRTTATIPRTIPSIAGNEGLAVAEAAVSVRVEVVEVSGDAGGLHVTMVRLELWMVIGGRQ
ncbi:hypothetical protein MLD38_022632 [Melastoma candidum]|uniref:Uncharacterized protein n=1 Tax=Melastoma candidum TaxID=119954 RepID=A0ACB9QJ89_9MYRT|nr:hypothetical protein MLD38_022632 [Melastoma candidum]